MAGSSRRVLGSCGQCYSPVTNGAVKSPDGRTQRSGPPWQAVPMRARTAPWSVAAALVLTLLPVAGARAAGPQAPGQTRSHYLTSVDPALLSRTGTADAGDAVVQGLAQALVVLDAGSPNGTDGSVRLPDTHVNATPTQVRT